MYNGLMKGQRSISESTKNNNSILSHKISNKGSSFKSSRINSKLNIVGNTNN